MANPEHVAKLKEGVEAWNAWVKLEREGDPRFRPDLTALDFRQLVWRQSALFSRSQNWVAMDEIDLIRSDCSGSNFTGTSLANANFQDAKLDDTVFERVRLWGSNFQEADLTRAKLNGSYLLDAIFIQASMRHADLSDASLPRTELQEADLSYACVKRADLYFANFQDAFMDEVDFQNANLHGARFRNSYLVNAKFQGAELQFADLRSAELRLARFQGADLHSADLENANMPRATLGLVGWPTNLTNAMLKDVNMADVYYERSVLKSRCRGLRGASQIGGNAILRRDLLDQDYLDSLIHRWARSFKLLALKSFPPWLQWVRWPLAILNLRNFPVYLQGLLLSVLGNIFARRAD